MVVAESCREPRTRPIESRLGAGSFGPQRRKWHPARRCSPLPMFYSVPKEGLEPSRPFGRRILSPLRLPFRHFGSRLGVLRPNPPRPPIYHGRHACRRTTNTTRSKSAVVRRTGRTPVRAKCYAAPSFRRVMPPTMARRVAVSTGFSRRGFGLRSRNSRALAEKAPPVRKRMRPA